MFLKVWTLVSMSIWFEPPNGYPRQKTLHNRMIMCFSYWNLLFPHPFLVSSPSLTLFLPFILNFLPCLLSLQHCLPFSFCVYIVFVPILLIFRLFSTHLQYSPLWYSPLLFPLPPYLNLFPTLRGFLRPSSHLVFDPPSTVTRMEYDLKSAAGQSARSPWAMHLLLLFPWQHEWCSICPRLPLFRRNTTHFQLISAPSFAFVTLQPFYNSPRSNSWTKITM